MYGRGRGCAPPGLRRSPGDVIRLRARADDLLTCPPPPPPPPPTRKRSERPEMLSESSDDESPQIRRRRMILQYVEDDPEERKTKANVEDPNWRWPAYDQINNGRGIVYVRHNEVVVGPTNTGSPFLVVYRILQDRLWPDAVSIKLKSPDLMKILSKYLPAKKGLQYMEKLDIDGRELWLVLDELHCHQFSDHNDETPTSATSKKRQKTSATTSMPAENGSFNDSKSDIQNQSGHIQVSETVGISEADVSELGSKESDQSDIQNQNGHIQVSETVGISEADVSELGSKESDLKSEERDGAEQIVNKGRLHLSHLLRFMNEEYKDVARKHRHMKEEKSASFDMLWVFLRPGAKVVYTSAHTQELLCATVSNNAYRSSSRGYMFCIWLDVWDYNGAVYRKCEITRTIPSFSEDRPLDSLAVWPIELHRKTPPEVLEADFISRGRKFGKLAMQSRNCFMYYRGPMFREMGCGISKDKADGRAMVDLRSFARMNPNYDMGSAQPRATYGVNNSPYESDSDDDIDSEDNFNSNIDIAAMAMTVGTQQISNDILLFAPAIVYGFSFTLKQWGAFAVTGFSEISFDANSFNALVMEPDLKFLLFKLVGQYVTRSAASQTHQSLPDAPRVDPIANKGEGCIFLCYGPPGTGKTLTAESIAENMRRPLWALSVAELGTTPNTLEKTLVNVLEIAAMWKAVLLLDEADVYLEKRDSSADVTRNAMTGVFLRLLEYYRGVLFLTTNRIMTFDDAFRSRISLFLCYPNLNEEQRLQIWKASLARVQAGTGDDAIMSTEFLEEISRWQMNGREIRNAIQLARTLATSGGENLQEKHVRLVMNVITTSSVTLDAALQNVQDEVAF